MLLRLETLLRRAHAHRWLHLAVVNLRYLIGFAFVPAGLKKVLDQPFTDPANHGRFHDFLHASTPPAASTSSWASCSSWPRCCW